MTHSVGKSLATERFDPRHRARNYMAEENAVLIPIMNDADISTGPLGAERIYYGRPIPFIYRAQSINTFADVYYSSSPGAGNNSVKVIAEWSIDGINWRAFTVDLIPPTTSVGPLRGNSAVVIADFCFRPCRLRRSLPDRAES